MRLAMGYWRQFDQCEEPSSIEVGLVVHREMMWKHVLYNVSIG